MIDALGDGREREREREPCDSKFWLLESPG